MTSQLKKALLLLIVGASLTVSLVGLPAQALAAEPCITPAGYIDVGKVEPCLYDNKDFPWIMTTWRWSLTIVNSFAIVVLIVMAFANILYPVSFLEPYRIRQLLPSFIWGMILANASIFICRATVAFADVLMQSFAVDIGNLYGAWGIDPSKLSLGIIQAKNGIASTAAQGGWTTNLYNLIVSTILVYLPVILMAALALIFWMRFAVIFLATAVSPLAFGALVFPATQKYMGVWWGWFWKWTFGGIASYLILYLAAQIVPSPTNKSLVLDVIPYGIASALVYMAIMAPIKMGGALGAGLISKAKSFTKFGAKKAFQGTKFVTTTRKGGYGYNAIRQWGATTWPVKAYHKRFTLGRKLADDKYETTHNETLREGAYERLIERKADKARMGAVQFNAKHGLEYRKLKGMVRPTINEDATAQYQYAGADELERILEAKRVELAAKYTALPLGSAQAMHTAATNNQLQYSDWNSYSAILRAIQVKSQSRKQVNFRGGVTKMVEGDAADMILTTLDPTGATTAGKDPVGATFAHQNVAPTQPTGGGTANSHLGSNPVATNVATAEAVAKLEKEKREQAAKEAAENRKAASATGRTQPSTFAAAEGISMSAPGSAPPPITPGVIPNVVRNNKTVPLTTATPIANVAEANKMGDAISQQIKLGVQKGVEEGLLRGMQKGAEAAHKEFVQSFKLNSIPFDASNFKIEGDFTGVHAQLTHELSQLDPVDVNVSLNTSDATRGFTKLSNDQKNMVNQMTNNMQRLTTNARTKVKEQINNLDKLGVKQKSLIGSMKKTAAAFKSTSSGGSSSHEGLDSITPSANPDGSTRDHGGESIV